MKPKSKKILFVLAAIAGAALVIFLIFRFYRCPIKLFFGVSCPGCGFSRAMAEAFRLNFTGAFSLFPVWPAVVLILVYFFVRIFVRLPAAVDYSVLGAGSGILLVQYIVRLCLHTLPA